MEIKDQSMEHKKLAPILSTLTCRSKCEQRNWFVHKCGQVKYIFHLV